MTQNNLGTAYGILAGIENKKENSEKAILAYNEALKIYTFEQFSTDYATTQSNLGTAYGRLAEVENKNENGEKAIDAYNEALKIFTIEDYPEQHQRTKHNLKNTKIYVSIKYI